MLWLQEIQCNTPARNPIPRQLPEDQTTVGVAFKVIGRDFAGPVKYKQGKETQGNACLAIFTCSLSQAIPYLPIYNAHPDFPNRFLKKKKYHQNKKIAVQ